MWKAIHWKLGLFEVIVLKDYSLFALDGMDYFVLVSIFLLITEYVSFF